MQVLLWSGMFLVTSVGGSAIELAGLIGVPITQGTQFAIATLAAFVVASGIALMLVTHPTSTPTE